MQHTSRPHLLQRVSVALASWLALLSTLPAQANEAQNGRPSAKVLQQMQLALATPEQMSAAERVLVGQYDCEFGQRISIDPHDGQQGYFRLRHGQQSWLMKPTLTATGAVRLEDVRGAALMIQILTKSMLLDPRKGQRLVDGCVHQVQREAERELASRPRQSMFGLQGDAGR